jgi:hypothetical protein
VRWRFVSMLVASHLATIALSVQLCTLWNLHQSQQEQELFTIPETAIRPQDLLTIPETAISPQELLTITETDVSTARRIDQNRTMNVLFGMQGKSQVFIDEWEVSLKSILLNAPIDASLHIHIVANNAARVAVSEKIQKVGLEGTRWRNPVTITVYDVEKYQKEWTAFIQQKIRKGNEIDERVTLGGYYRLLAFKVIPPSIGPVIYMDTDVVILTNLNDIWKLVDREKVIQLATSWVCSGFMILHMDKFDLFWAKLDTVPKITHGGDQHLVKLFTRHFPESVGELPERWDAHLGNGFKAYPHLIVKQRPNGTGYIHFNGERPKRETFWAQGLSQYCTGVCEKHPRVWKPYKRNFEGTWGLADYYIKVAWPWLLYFGRSTIGFDEEGHILRFEIIEGTAHQ